MADRSRRPGTAATAGAHLASVFSRANISSVSPVVTARMWTRFRYAQTDAHRRFSEAVEERGIFELMCRTEIKLQGSQAAREDTLTRLASRLEEPNGNITSLSAGATATGNLAAEQQHNKSEVM